MSDRWFCRLCPEELENLAALIVHLDFDHDELIETWPDGEPVMWDQTLEPSDFEAVER